VTGEAGSKPRVLLARPHDFMQEDVKAALLASGAEPVAIDTLDTLRSHKGSALAGLVASTAVTSSMPSTLREVLTVLASDFPAVPLVLTGLAGFEVIAQRVRDEGGAALKLVELADGVILTKGSVLVVTAADFRARRDAVKGAFTQLFSPAPPLAPKPPEPPPQP